jgi:hypothetical protein
MSTNTLTLFGALVLRTIFMEMCVYKQLGSASCFSIVFLVRRDSSAIFLNVFRFDLVSTRDDRREY